ncbi:2-oxoglutarate synthase [Methanolacinia petrolearia DSM 11571]|uniref:2-oxoglutarate synthase n=1 Tax=Methanolacinia petrolearia (strain DSM 11571 / OCM 486 / SEBR 4847) TaxID=679926 RepID=E1RI85_METP4|nr:thiamine pyrophosphate-dependent enzyme [Methanolacinia petrolearia]ADN36550.1 2-oxoglutarate synthase [Methanolacinia petrolearia DSM 11571]
MAAGNLITDAPNTWCEGCGNFAILHSIKNIIEEFGKEGIKPEQIVLVTGIGCHAKIADYLNINTLYSLHGRAIPYATGIKIANPDLKVICCVGDGDSYAEGLEHLLFAAKRNLDITVVVHDNRVYGLTTGQYTPTSPDSYHGKSNPPDGSDLPFNPLKLMLCSGATFIGRGYTGRMDHLQDLIKKGISHRGFSFIEVIQICASFYNKSQCYDEHVYDYEGDTGDINRAFSAASEWDYNSDARIPLGLIYRAEREIFEERFSNTTSDPEDRRKAVLEYLNS